MPLPSSHTDKADCLAVVIQQGDARDLILQLYREIGISAVAAALDAGRSGTPVKTAFSLPDSSRQDRAA